MLPRGFRLSAAEAAIKKPGRKDMALVFTDPIASAAGVFTKNKVKGAPVVLDMERIASGRGAAIVVNSGNANACTGKRGMRDARETTRLLSRALDVPEELVYVCSTGVIGVPMPMKRVREGVGRLVEGIGKAGMEDVARAIMTTDTFPKYLSRKIRMGRTEGTLSGFCKGSGMIHPGMATMLCFFMTDLAVEKRALKTALVEAVEASFNRISVDGDQSTSDTVLALANGAVGNKPITTRSRYYGKFRAALSEAALGLSKEIVRDGEGATKFVEVAVTGAKSALEAERGARAVANSMLVKTAIFGEDPNWGRIIAAVGASGITVKEEKTSISIGGVRLFARGRVTGREAEARKKLKGKDVIILVDLGLGKGRATMLTCDLSYDYVKINAEYTT